MKYRIFYLFLFLGLLAEGQILDSESSILQKIGGEPIFKLAEGERVYSGDSKDGWYKIRKTAYVSHQSLVDEKYLSEGTVLYDKEGNKIGSLLKEIRVNDFRLHKTFRQEDRYAVNISGYIFKTAFVEGSMPEERLSALLAVKNRNEQIQGMQELFEMYQFEEREFGELTAYSFADPNSSSSENNDFRITVIMRGESSVYAVISNDHIVELERTKDLFEEDPYRIVYIYKPSPANKKLIEEEILYTFVQL